MSRKFRFHKNLTRIMCTLHEYLRILMTISRLVLPRTRNISEKNIVEKNKTHILCSIFFFFSENLTVYKTTWKNMVEPGRPQMTI